MVVLLEEMNKNHTIRSKCLFFGGRIGIGSNWSYWPSPYQEFGPELGRLLRLLPDKLKLNITSY